MSDNSDSNVLKIKKNELIKILPFVHDGLNEDLIERAEDISNISHDHENRIHIKIKHELKNELLDENNMDAAETLTYETDPVIIDGKNDPKMNNNFEFKDEYAETHLELELLINEMRHKYQWTFRGEPWIPNPIDAETHLELELLINEMRHKYQWTFRGEPWIPNPIIQNHFLGPLLDSQFPRKDV